jgi:hypothetical protein
MANVPVRHRMKRNVNLDVFTDEYHADVGAAAFVLAELKEATGHDYFSKEDLVIRTASGGGGVLLVLNTHYSLSEENTTYSTLATNAAGATKTIYKKIQIIDPTYQAGDLWYSGEYFTDYLDPSDLNNITRKIVAVGGVYTVADYPGNNIYAITTGAGSFAFNTPDPTKNIDLEILAYKADTGAGICTATPNGADTYMGATAFPLRKYGDFIHLKSDGTNWYVIDSLSTIDSDPLDTNQTQTWPHGMGVKPTIVSWCLLCLTAEYGYAIGDEAWNVESYLTGDRYVGIKSDATNIMTRISNPPAIQRFDAYSYGAITPANWAIRIRYKL